MSAAAPPTLPAAEFLQLLERCDRAGALALVRSLSASGVSAATIVAELLAPAQRRIGELWQAGEWTVSQEHAATAIVEAVLADVGSGADEDVAARGRVVLACCEEEWHSLPAGMLETSLRSIGWDVTFLGASTAAEGLDALLRSIDPVALLVSCSVSMNLPGAARMIDAAHAGGYRVLVGGAAFTRERAGALGADAWAGSVPEADALLAGWLTNASPPAASERRGALAAAALEIARRDLVDDAMAALLLRLPVMAGFSSRQLSRTRADFGYIVDFAAAALLVSDDTVFFEFAEWLDGILTRLAYPGVLATALEVLVSVTSEHPELVALLERGISELAASLLR